MAYTLPATIAAEIDSQERGSTMLRVSRLSLVAFCVVTGAASLLASASVPLASQTSATESAKTWLDKRQSMEDYLRTGRSHQDGGHRPRRHQDRGGHISRRAVLFDRMAWKTIRPGFHQGSGRATSRRSPPTSSTSFWPGHDSADCRTQGQERNRRRGHVGLADQELQGSRRPAHAARRARSRHGAGSSFAPRCSTI